MTSTDWMKPVTCRRSNSKDVSYILYVSRQKKKSVEKSKMTGFTPVASGDQICFECIKYKRHFLFSLTSLLHEKWYFLQFDENWY